jgi:hypothetical protein
MTSSLTIRPARRSDAAEMALLMNIAGHSMPSFVWSMLDADSSVESPIETGRLRAMRDDGSFSWRNTELAEQGDEVVGLLAGYRQPDIISASEGTSDVHPVFAPLVGLEAEAAGTWYVNALAVSTACASARRCTRRGDGCQGIEPDHCRRLSRRRTAL